MDLKSDFVSTFPRINEVSWRHRLSDRYLLFTLLAYACPYMCGILTLSLFFRLKIQNLKKWSRKKVPRKLLVPSLLCCGSYKYKRSFLRKCKSDGSVHSCERCLMNIPSDVWYITFVEEMQRFESRITQNKPAFQNNCIVSHRIA